MPVSKIIFILYWRLSQDAYLSLVLFCEPRPLRILPEEWLLKFLKNNLNLTAPQKVVEISVMESDIKLHCPTQL